MPSPRRRSAAAVAAVLALAALRLLALAALVVLVLVDRTPDPVAIGVAAGGLLALALVPAGLASRTQAQALRDLPDLRAVYAQPRMSELPYDRRLSR